MKQHLAEEEATVAHLAMEASERDVVRLRALIGAAESPVNTEAELAELESVFNSMDKDHNGRVSYKEWMRGLAKNEALLSRSFGGTTLKEVGRAFRRLDGDKDMSLTWEEFKSGIINHQSDSRAKETELDEARIDLAKMQATATAGEAVRQRSQAKLDAAEEELSDVAEDLRRTKESEARLESSLKRAMKREGVLKGLEGPDEFRDAAVDLAQQLSALEIQHNESLKAPSLTYLKYSIMRAKSHHHHDQKPPRRPHAQP